MTVDITKVKIGSKIYFAEERKPYVVKSCSDRFAICTKPHNLRKTCWYTIIDFASNVRGPNNLVFNCFDYCIQKDCDNSLARLTANIDEVSYRNRIKLNIVKIEEPKQSNATQAV